jgi:hypothetical protein
MQDMVQQVMDSGRKRATDRHVVQDVLYVVLPLLLALFLYWPTLSQPYFWDDLPHFEFATTRTFLQIWTDVRGLSYYRPVIFTLYKIFFGLLPRGATTLPHTFLLLVHTANAWLVGCVARRLLKHTPPGTGEEAWFLGWTTPGMAGLLAALLFVSYPFAVLPVSHFAAAMHPLVTLFILSGILSALNFLSSGKIRWLVTAIILALVAPFTHESGIMAGPIAATMALLYDWSMARQNWKPLLLLACISGVFLPVWWLVPKTPNTFQWIGWGGILASTTFFAQGPTFPAQLLSRLLIDRLAQGQAGISPTVVGLPWWVLGTIWAVSFVALFFAGWVLWRAHRLRILAISLAWTFLAALPSIAVLPFPYVSVSQRLLYSGGPAAALLWATVCVSLAAHARPVWARSVGALALAALIAAVPILYIQREMALHELALRPLEQLAAIASHSPNERHLVVNPPNWVNYRQPWYALGQEGVSVSADYVDFNRLVWLNSGRQGRTYPHDSQFVAATFPAIKAELPDHYYSTINEEVPWDETRFAAEAPGYDRVWLIVYADEAISTQEVGSVRLASSTSPKPYLASFEDRVYLLGATLDLQERAAIATLHWQALDRIEDVTIFSHLLDCHGHFLGQKDGFALGGMLPFDQLEPGSEVDDVRYIPTETSSDDGCYQLVVGLYLPDSTRITARGPDGQGLQDNEVSLTFTR